MSARSPLNYAHKPTLTHTHTTINNTERHTETNTEIFHKTAFAIPNPLRERIYCTNKFVPLIVLGVNET